MSYVADHYNCAIAIYEEENGQLTLKSLWHRRYTLAESTRQVLVNVRIISIKFSAGASEGDNHYTCLLHATQRITIELGQPAPTGESLIILGAHHITQLTHYTHYSSCSSYTHTLTAFFGQVLCHAKAPTHQL